MAPRPREREIEEDRSDDVVVVVDPKDKTMLADADTDVEDDGPDNAAARRQAEADAARRPPRAAAVADEDEEDARLAYDDDEGEDRGVGGRRARRNRARRERDTQSAQQIAALTGRVQELQTHLESMSRGQLSLAAGDIDGQIQTEQGRLQTIDAALAKAVKEGDDVTFARANQLRDEARDRIAQLGAERYRLAAVARQSPQPAATAQRPAAAAAPDPVAVRHSETFMSRHDWFNPDDPADEDSQIVRAIDDALANEGYRPNTPLYWRELERRVAARGLGKSGDDDVDDRDQDRDERPAPRRNGGMPPRAGRGSGDRPAGGSRTLRLDDTMKEVLESEGLLEVKGLTEDQLKLRRKYVKSWDDGFKAEAARARR